MNGRCPACGCEDAITVSEVSRAVPAFWWQRIVGQTVRRIITGYIHICAACQNEYIVTQTGVMHKRRGPAPAKAPQSETGEPPAPPLPPRAEYPMTRAKPPS